MAKFDIWIEGYAATGEHVTAWHEGEWEGETFADACKAWPEADPTRLRNYDHDQLAYWGCRMYSNEVDARKGFG